MTASLYHGHSILRAAINAGFRESGVQSLKNLYDADAFPMVAVRSSGLTFESLIGYSYEDEEGNERLQSLVSEEYLKLLTDIANERFKINAERIRRFEEQLFGRSDKSLDWESTDSRKTRKKAEGLALQALVQRHKNLNSGVCHGDGEDVTLELKR